MIGTRLARARAAAGLSMAALGEQVGVSANMVKKYEHDQSVPSSGKLLLLAKALGVRTEYFFRPVEVELQGIEYRKHSRMPAGMLKRIEADVLDQAERWQELVNLWPVFPVPAYEPAVGLPQSIESLDAIDAFTDRLRDSWKLGQNPIPDLIDLLETRGVLVIVTDVEAQARFDGLQAMIGSQPVIVVSANWPGDRQRFTLAHELGHLLLGGRIALELDEEKACHRFAASFLLPAGGVIEHLGKGRHTLEPQELYLLKHEFGLSMQACLYRARDVGVIDDKVFNRLFKHFSMRGWRKQEPGEPYPSEQTRLFQQLVYRALGEGIVGESKAAELLGVPLMAFHRARKLEPVDAAAGQ